MYLYFHAKVYLESTNLVVASPDQGLFSIHQRYFPGVKR